MARQAQALARLLGWSGAAVLDAALGGLLHDIGNLVIDSTVLLKQGRLTGAEWKLIRSHPVPARRSSARSRRCSTSSPISFTITSTGMARAIRRACPARILLAGGRLIAVADVFDTLISLRPYRTARSIISALAESRRRPGRNSTRLSPPRSPAVTAKASCHQPRLAHLAKVRQR